MFIMNFDIFIPFYENSEMKNLSRGKIYAVLLPVSTLPVSRKYIFIGSECIKNLVTYLHLMQFCFEILISVVGVAINMDEINQI